MDNDLHRFGTLPEQPATLCKPPPALRQAAPPPRPGEGLATISCARCSVRHLCLPAEMNDSQCAMFEPLVLRRRLLLRGETLRHMNEPANGRMYAVHSGQLKCYHVSQAGEQRITALPTAGELLGLDSIGCDAHTTAVSANCPSIVCELNYPQLLAAARQFTALARRLELLLSKELARQQAVNLILTSPRAEQKLAMFLLQAAWVHVQRGADGVRIEPQLSRRDIADYLGLTDATIARLLQRFIQAGCIAVCRRRFTLLDSGLLREIAAGECSTAGKVRHTLAAKI